MKIYVEMDGDILTVFIHLNNYRRIDYNIMSGKIKENPKYSMQVKASNIRYGRAIPRDKNTTNSPSVSKRVVLSAPPPVTQVRDKIIQDSIKKTATKSNVISAPIQLTPNAGLEPSTNRLTVSKNSWYGLNIKIVAGTEYKKGILKIFDGEGKILLLPTIRLPNIIFSKVDKVKSIEELNHLDEFNIYFKTGDTNVVQIYTINFGYISGELHMIDDKSILKNVSLWRLRRLYDLEFINYYIDNVNEETIDKTFLDRFRSENRLCKTPQYFENYIAGLKMDLKTSEEITDKFNTLYLIHSSIQYEDIGYTLRTHNLLKNTNNDKYKVFGVTRYGYPYDRPAQYYTDKKKTVNIDIDNVTYLKLLQGEDNFNNNNIEDYLKKYIKETIKLAHTTNAKVIHATTNFWNGISAVYAAKYLKIKSIYEIRGFWEESALSFQPEIYDSDLLKMRNHMEKIAMENCDKIVVINELLKEALIKEGISADKIEVISNGVDSDKFRPNEDNRELLIKEHNLESADLIIGYIGSLLNYEGIEYIMDSIKKIKDENNLDIKLVLIGDGVDREEILNHSKKIRINNNILYLGKKENKDVIKYYDLFDIVCYPRKNERVCNTTSSSKLMEAMSMEKPLIVSDLSAYRDILEENKTCLFMKPDDTDDLTDKILRLYNDIDLRLELGRNAREWILENRNWKVLGERVRDIYSTL